MGLISKNRLTAIANTKRGTRMFSAIITDAKNENRNLAEVTVFLSHSHDDLTNGNYEKVIVFLRNCGVRVYIDSLDRSMPPFTNAETARKIKEQIKANKKFLFLASTNAISSKWCNWELGYGDAHKYIDNIALFPLIEDSGQWNGNEYLRIYPRIEESNVISDYFKVIYPNGREQSIKDWLKK